MESERSTQMSASIPNSSGLGSKHGSDSTVDRTDSPTTEEGKKASTVTLKSFPLSEIILAKTKETKTVPVKYIRSKIADLDRAKAKARKSRFALIICVVCGILIIIIAVVATAGEWK